MRRWMLHGNVSRKGYGNALMVGMVAILRKDIRRLMMTERIMPRVWMHRRSMRQLASGALNPTQVHRSVLCEFASESSPFAGICEHTEGIAEGLKPSIRAPVK